MITSSSLFRINEEYRKNMICIGFSDEESQIFLDYLKGKVLPPFKTNFDAAFDEFANRWNIDDQIRPHFKAAFWNICSLPKITIESKQFKHLANLLLHMAIHLILESMANLTCSSKTNEK